MKQMKNIKLPDKIFLLLPSSVNGVKMYDDVRRNAEKIFCEILIIYFLEK